MRDDQEGRRHAGSDHEEDLHHRDLIVPFSLVQTDDPQNPLDPPDPNPYSNFFHFMGGLKICENQWLMQKRIEEGLVSSSSSLYIFFFLPPLLLSHPPHSSIDALAVGGARAP